MRPLILALLCASLLCSAASSSSSLERTVQLYVNRTVGSHERCGILAFDGLSITTIDAKGVKNLFQFNQTDKFNVTNLGNCSWSTGKDELATSIIFSVLLSSAASDALVNRTAVVNMTFSGHVNRHHQVDNWYLSFFEAAVFNTSDFELLNNTIKYTGSNTPFSAERGHGLKCDDYYAKFDGPTHLNHTVDVVFDAVEVQPFNLNPDQTAIAPAHKQSIELCSAEPVTHSHLLAIIVVGVLGVMVIAAVAMYVYRTCGKRTGGYEPINK